MSRRWRFAIAWTSLGLVGIVYSVVFYVVAAAIGIPAEIRPILGFITGLGVGVVVMLPLLAWADKER